MVPMHSIPSTACSGAVSGLCVLIVVLPLSLHTSVRHFTTLPSTLHYPTLHCIVDGGGRTGGEGARVGDCLGGEDHANTVINLLIHSMYDM